MSVKRLPTVSALRLKRRGGLQTEWAWIPTGGSAKLANWVVNATEGAVCYPGCESQHKRSMAQALNPKHGRKEETDEAHGRL